jgi:hypothetical protein
MKNMKPKPGDILTLAMDYWHGVKKGTKVKVIGSRKDKQCKSGLRITVEIPGLEYGVKKLNATWFKEYPEDFKYA